MNDEEKHLDELEEALAEGEKVLRLQKKKLKGRKKKEKKLEGRQRGKLQKENDDRIMKTLKEGVEGIKEQRDLLEDKLEQG